MQKQMIQTLMGDFFQTGKQPSRRIIFKLQITLALKILKFNYCEKSIKLEKISNNVLKLLDVSKQREGFFQIFVAFSQ